MKEIDWAIVFVLNVGVILLGLWLARGTRSSDQWFLAGRALPWWAVGLSMYATNVDNADLVSITSTSYREGLHIMMVHSFGSVLASTFVAFWFIPVIYRAGLYTNAEYLEARFGRTTRILSALIQIQYRTSMLGLMIWSIFLLLNGFVGLSATLAWTLIVVLATFAAIYTAWGGLRSVVFTDAAQAIIILLGVAAILFAVWNEAGGWSGMTEKLTALDKMELDNGLRPSDLPRMGSYRGDDGSESPLVIAVAWLLVAGGYWTVNHTQTMRLMGARSLWDIKMAALAGATISMPIMFASASLGIFGRALHPEFEDPDKLYPHLAHVLLDDGTRGLVVAGIIAAAISTFDSMGSALSAVFTRDIYGLFRPNRDDAHYVRVSRIATVVILALGFAYLPFIRSKGSMLTAFLTLIPVFVSPLFTVYLVGVFTRAPRISGIVGLLVGAAYGVIALVDREVADLGLPNGFTGRWAAYPWSFAFTFVTMIIVTCVRGREDRRDLALASSTWSKTDHDSSAHLLEHPFREGVPTHLRPGPIAIAVIAVTAYLVFWVFW